jgi:hypothetical protein
MIAVVVALLFEQWRPATHWPVQRIDGLLRAAIDGLPERLDGGREWHAWLGWSLAVLPRWARVKVMTFVMAGMARRENGGASQ